MTRAEQKLWSNFILFVNSRDKLLKDIEDLTQKAQFYMERNNIKDFGIYLKQANSTSFTAHKVVVAIHKIENELGFDKIKFQHN